MPHYDLWINHLAAVTDQYQLQVPAVIDISNWNVIPFLVVSSSCWYVIVIQCGYAMNHLTYPQMIAHIIDHAY